MADSSPTELKIHFRSSSDKLIKTLKKVFSADPYPRHLSATQGDTFLDAPSADLLVLPTNSFGFLTGAAGTQCAGYFGAQLQERLQEVIREHFTGEMLIGQCAIIPAYPPETELSSLKLDSKNNQGQPIRYVAAVSNVRVPDDASDTRAVFLAFRGVILAVRKHNSKCEKGVKSLVPIGTVICPDLKPEKSVMSADLCVEQLKIAFDAYFLKIVPILTQPEHLGECWSHEDRMITEKK